MGEQGPDFPDEFMPFGARDRPHRPLLSQPNAGTNCGNNLHQPIGSIT
jgi:hypothetical protein